MLVAIEKNHVHKFYSVHMHSQFRPEDMGQLETIYANKLSHGLIWGD